MEQSAVQAGPMAVEIFSFGFKHGMPQEVNMLFDVRFLPNPYWEEEMRHLTGKNEEVAAYVLESESGRAFLARLTELLDFLFQQHRQAGRDMLRIGIGCTGGQHRSVAVVERLGSKLHTGNILLTISHRDIARK